MPPKPAPWAAPLPRLRGDRWRAVAPAVLLVVVAAIGVRNHADRDQSSWAGASFGMFATYENDVSRLVEVTVTGPAGPFRAKLPPDLQDDAQRLRVAPSQGSIDRLARAVAAKVRPDGATAVAVVLWKVVLDDRDRLWLRLEPALRADAVP